jgi:hypothetical protein
MNEEVIDEEAIVLAEAEDVRVEAAAPVRARTTTKARTMFFMGVAPCGDGRTKVVDNLDIQKIGSYCR